MRYKNRRAKELVDLGSKLFTKRQGLDNLNQEIAWQFAPDLASFNQKLELGEDFMSDHMDSVPVMTSRELSNQMAAHLRPQDRFWFRSTTLDDYVDADEENAQFLEYISKKTWRGIYDPRSQLIASSKEADRFYINFGQAVMSVNEAPGTRDHLFFKNFHISDCAWLENDIGEVDHLHRKQMMTARAMNRRWGGEQYNLHDSIRRAARREPDREFEVRVVTLPAEEYDDLTMGEGSKSSGKRKQPFVICYIDVEHGMVIRDSGLVTFNYIVPRWHRFAGSQYAFSPAAMTALPDARMAQMLAQILLDAGEKAVEPPLVGKKDMVIGEPNLMSGAISWIDVEHEGKLEDALQAMQMDADVRVGFELRRDVRDMLARAFYLDKLELPDVAVGGEMTAFEVARRLEQHTRNLLPLFEPMQIEYNTRLLDIAFAFLVNMKKIDFRDAPRALRGGDFTWAFESPVQQARNRIMVEQFRDTLEVVAAAKEMGAMASPINIDVATRDAVRGVDGPATWRKTMDEQADEAGQTAQKAAMAENLDAINQAGQAGIQVGEAGQKLGLIPENAGAAGAPQAVNGNSAPLADGQAPALAVPENAFGDMGAQLSELAGSGETLPVPAAAPALTATSAPAMATAQGDMGDVLTMQRRILMKLEELGEVMRAPRKIDIDRDSNGRIKGAASVIADREREAA